MSETILILGQSGTGKTTSLRNLKAEETFIFQATAKMLPFKGAKKKYDKHVFTCDNVAKLLSYIAKIDKEKPEIKNIIVDDIQYIMSNEFMRRAYENGFQKFTDIGHNIWKLFTEAKNLRPDLKIFFFGHTQTSDEGKEKMKTIGKLLDDKITPEGMFSIVLFTKVTDGVYKFSTKNSGQNTCKAPMDMFETDLIDNDLQIVIDAIDNYGG